MYAPVAHRDQAAVLALAAQKLDEMVDGTSVTKPCAAIPQSSVG